MYLFNLVGASCLATSLPGTLQNQFSRLGSCPPPRTCRQTLWNCERSLIFDCVVKVTSRTHSSVQRVPKFTIASLSSSLCIGEIEIFLILKLSPSSLSTIINNNFDLLILPSLLWSNTLKAALTSSFKSQLPLKSQSQDQNHIISPLRISSSPIVLVC